MAQMRETGKSAQNWTDVPFSNPENNRDFEEGRRASQNDTLLLRLGLRGHKHVIALACLLITILAVVSILRSGTGHDDLILTRDEATSGTETLSAASETTQETSEAPNTPQCETVVHIDGAVTSPGVYRLTMDEPRVSDAVEAAGGLSADADTSMTNLAEIIADGTKIHIFRLDEVPVPQYAAPLDNSPSTPSSGTNTSNGGLLNVNTATAEQLQELPGVGEVTAKAIVSNREQNGPFSTVDELTRVDGIGEKKLARIRERICV